MVSRFVRPHLGPYLECQREKLELEMFKSGHTCCALTSVSPANRKLFRSSRSFPKPRFQ